MNEYLSGHIPDRKDTSDGRLDNYDQLRTAFLLLSPDQRMVIDLKVVKGFSNHDVAKALSKSIGAVKAIQDRGLMNLLHILFSSREGIAV